VSTILEIGSSSRSEKCVANQLAAFTIKRQFYWLHIYRIESSTDFQHRGSKFSRENHFVDELIGSFSIFDINFSLFFFFLFWRGTKMNQKKEYVMLQKFVETFFGDSPLASNGKTPFVEIPRKRILLLDASRKWRENSLENFDDTRKFDRAIQWWTLRRSWLFQDLFFFHQIYFFFFFP